MSREELDIPLFEVIDEINIGDTTEINFNDINEPKFSRVEEPEEKEKKEKKKPTKKPTWTLTKYDKNTIALGINNGLPLFINKTILRNYEKLTPKECEEAKLGQSLAFAIDYYIPDVPTNHPLMIVGGALLSLGIIIQSKMVKQKPQQKEIDQKDFNVDV